MREGEKVRFLELFFDLVFVLAFTQATGLIVANPTWTGVAQGVLFLAVLWWSWVGYAWLTSVVDPEEGAVRFAMFGAMAGLLVVVLAAPEVFGDEGLTFAIAYAVVRIAQVVLLGMGGRDDPNLRHSVLTGLAVSTPIGVGLLFGASFLDGWPRLGLWALALVIDLGGPALFGVEGWRMVPAHFAERHGLVVILALGESIVVIGAGASHTELTAGVIIAGILGIALSSALWWTYFDMVAIVTEQRLHRAAVGRAQNAFARDSYSYLHLPMVAGIILVAVGVEETVAHVDEHLHTIPAFCLLGGVALYLLSHVALRLRNAHSISYPRLILAVVLVALTPVATTLPAWVTLLGVTMLTWALVAFETRSYGENRSRTRHQSNEH